MKRNIFNPVLVILLFSLITYGCSKTDDGNLPTDPIPINLTAAEVTLVNSGNSFSFDIFKKVISAEDEVTNIMISPLSISYALSMTMNGANGATRDAMLNALRVSGITPEEINKSYKSLTEALLNVDKRVIVTIANSVWTEDQFSVKKPFTDILTSYYDAESKQFDVNDPAAPSKMNKWIEDNTNGLIKNMIDQLDPATVMLLINAIYFKGKWKSQFDADETVNSIFYKPGGLQINVPVMKQKEKFKAFRGTDFTIAEFPYGQGNFVMDIILPDAQDGISTLTNTLTAESFSGWIGQMQETEIQLSMPKFKYGFKKKLKDILTDMGMGLAFTDDADFTNISSDYPLAIDNVTHQAFIETNEEGTEAAAATVVSIIVTSLPQVLVLNLDHPFLYIIRETTTNSIIFMGRVSDPLAN